MTNEELQAIKERAEKATPGPWLAVPIVDSYEYVVVGDSKREAITGEVYERDDAIFIEYARSDVPKLLAEVERLKEEHGIMVAANKRMYDDRYKYKDALETILEGDAETLSDVIRIAKAAITHDRT